MITNLKKSLSELIERHQPPKITDEYKNIFNEILEYDSGYSSVTLCDLTNYYINKIFQVKYSESNKKFYENEMEEFSCFVDELIVYYGPETELSELLKTNL